MAVIRSPLLLLALGLLSGLFIRNNLFHLDREKGMPLDVINLIRKRFKANRTILIALCFAILPMLIPLCEGRAWNGLGPFSFNVVYPPENYSGPLPSSQITAESWGAASVIIPFQTQVKNYLLKGELPLWNPYQGLGQPFAAQGEGCPYFPVTILRALFPYTWSDYISLTFAYVAGFVLYLFLRNLGLAVTSAAFGSIAFIFSGAFYLHLARFNISDQICMIPILFWSAGSAVRNPNLKNLAVLSLISCLHLLGGFIQIAMLSAIVCVAFSLFYAIILSENVRGVFYRASMFLAYFILGNGLASFFLLPLLEAMQTTFNKNVEFLALSFVPSANLIAFFFPGVFGPFFQNWIPGNWPDDVISWDNLFGFSGCLLTLLLITGFYIKSGWEKSNRLLFLFFAITTIILLLRYISFSPVALLNFLPVLGRQSPKHSNGLIVFCIVVAASFVVDWLRFGGINKHLMPILYASVSLITISMLATLVYHQGGFGKINQWLAINGVLTTEIFIATSVIAIALSIKYHNPFNLLLAFSALIFAENLVYLPLGNPSLAFSYMRLALGLILVCAAYGFLLNYRRLAWATVIMAIVFYAGLIIPRSLLPKNIDLISPPTAMQWLAKKDVGLYRSFGIHPDFSSMSNIRDISVLGPLSPKSYLSFIKSITDKNGIASFKGSTVFMLEGYYSWRYPLSLYLKYKDLFDFAGVKYLFLNRDYFGPGLRNDDSILASPDAHLSIVYQDARVRIWRSDAAKSRFWLTSDFSSNADPTKVEFRGHNIDVSVPPKGAHVTGKLEVIEMRPNALDIKVITDSSQLFVTTDGYDPGWNVYVDGKKALLLRINGSFMGTAITTAGQHEIKFRYLPRSFIQGVVVSSICIFALIVGLLLPTRRRHSLPNNLEQKKGMNYVRGYTDTSLTLFFVCIADIISVYGVLNCYFFI